MEAAGYQSTADRQKFVEAVEAMTTFDAGLDHVQGRQGLQRQDPSVFSTQFISKVEAGKLARVHTTSIEDSLYPDAVDYTAQSF